MENNKPSKRYDETYDFTILSKESVITFLTALGYQIVEHESGRWDGYRFDEEWTVLVKLCAVKEGETPHPYDNEITVVFRKEFENSLLKLLVSSKDIPSVPTLSALPSVL